MATATMATAAGAAALLYYTLNRKLQTQTTIDEDGDESGSGAPTDMRFRVTHRLIQAPATWLETISTLSETLRFTYSETLGKWPIGDLAFGINFLLKRQVMTNAGFCFCCCLGFEATENGMINFGVLCLQLLTLITFEA
jgi:hypothetical protein